MDNREVCILLHPGKEKPVRQHHPWVFSGAIARVEGEASEGTVVNVCDSAGRFLARGVFNPRSQIAVRLLTWDEDETIDASFWQRRLSRAIQGRSLLAADAQTNAYRLVHAESDGLPGLVVDRYDSWLVVQFSAWAAEIGREHIIAALRDVPGIKGIMERADPTARRREHLPVREGPLWGEGPPKRLLIREGGHRFFVDVRGGQKTGFYLDQRENRRRVAVYAADQDALNAFCYTGAFAVYLLAAGASHVVNIDTSHEALALAEENLRLNGFDPDRQGEQVQGDVFAILRDWREERRQFSLIVLDPPKFAGSQAQVAGATRGYKDINLLALQLLRPGGILATFSCSGLVSADLFQKIVFGAAVDAGREVQVLERLSQGADHPILLSFPEGEYLKGMICRAL